MNPLFLLLGLLGAAGMAGSSGRGSSRTGATTENEIIPTTENEDDDVGPRDEITQVNAVTLVVYDDDGNVVREISNGDSLDFGDTDISGYKVGAEIDGSGFNSVLFDVNGTVFVQHIAPYDIASLDLSGGDYTVTVTVHSGFNGEGSLLASETVDFDTDGIATAIEPAVTDDSADQVDASDDTETDTEADSGADSNTDDDTSDDTSADMGDDMSGDDTHDHGDMDMGDDTEAGVITFVVYDDDGNVVREFSNGDSLEFGDADVSGYKVGAEVSGADFSSILFEVGGQIFTQNLAPYDISAVDLSEGSHTVTASAYSGFNGEGDLVASETVSFASATGGMADDGADMGMDMGGDDGSHDHGSEDEAQDHIGTSSDGTPILIIFGQSNAGLFENSKALETALAEMGSNAQVIGVHDGGVSVAQADGAWNIVTGDGTDAPGYLYTELLDAVAAVRNDTSDAYIAGAVWMQGEADRSDNFDYYEPASTLFTQMQADLGEEFPITIVGLSDLQGGNDEGRQHVQDAQRQLAEDLDFVTFVDPDELIADNNLSEAEVMRDSLHFERDFFDYVADAVLAQPEIQDSLAGESGMTHDDMGDMDDDHDDHDMGGMDDMDDHAGHVMDDPAIDPPGSGASASEIATYLAALADLDESHSHDHGSDMESEHMAALGLVERGDATHVAIDSGDWDDPSIWSGGEVPGDDAKVLIPEGVAVDYGVVSDARLFTVRVDGALEFATDTDSQMIFDTMVVAPSGYLEIGTLNDPVDADVNVDLIVANNGRIDTDWDPQLLSRGIISHGKTSITGAEKDSHEKVSDDPMAGDTSVSMGDVPTGWQVGDTIVIAGTNYDGYSGDKTQYTPPEDEVRVITAIDDDGTIHFDEPLVYDHDSPRDDLKTSVANYTRNVSVESEDGADSEIYERGHVMFMHNDDVDVRYAEFTELGRTDKSEESRPVDEFNSIDYDTNVQGRYSLHLHRAGVEDLEDPAILEGNAVFGSPGWGYVHHDSNALLTNNASYDTFGAGFVAETGNETGSWVDNIAIYATGNAWNLPKNSVDIDEFYDIANGGDGFWFQGRMVSSYDNVAASVNHGYVYFHRDSTDTMISFSSDLFEYSDALHYDETIRADDIPITGFDGNEAFAANEGMHVVKANTSQGHDVWSHLTDFTAWNVEVGAHLQYTSHYILEGFDVVGKETSNYSDAETGILIGRNMSDLVIIDAEVDGFRVGMNLFKEFTDPDEGPELHSYFVIDADIKNVETAYQNYDPSLDTIISANQVAGDAPNLTLDRMEYSHSSNYHEQIVLIEGTKTDSLGDVTFPNGQDIFRLRQEDVVAHMENGGYYTTSDGDAYTLINVYFTDRLTGNLFYETHPIYLDDNVFSQRAFDDAVYNGVQDITTSGGTIRAGTSVLDQAFEVTSMVDVSAAASARMIENAGEVHAMEAAAVATETLDWMNGYDGDESLTLGIDDAQIFLNTGDMENTNVVAAGGKTILASDGTFELSDDHVLALYGSDLEVGFDGPDDSTALLELEDDATLFYVADADGLGTIEEFDSGAYDASGDVNSGVNLGNASLSIDLTALSPNAADAFALLSADELVGVFSEALITGLGDRDAKVVIDYENDSVSLELSEGNGAVEITTTGEQSDVTDGYEALWNVLTEGQDVLSDSDDTMMDDDDDHMMHDAA